MSETMAVHAHRRDVVRNEATAAAALYGVHVTDLLERNRSRILVRARTELYRRLRALGWSLPVIGLHVGRHHTSVLHALRAA